MVHRINRIQQIQPKCRATHFNGLLSTHYKTQKYFKQEDDRIVNEKVVWAFEKR